MVAPATVKRVAWISLASAAALFLAVAAWTGGRGGPGLAPFVATGLMSNLPRDAVRAIDVTSARGSWHFARTASGGWQATSGTPAAQFEPRLSTALTLLRNSGPERILSAEDVALSGQDQYRLDPPSLRVVVWSATEPLLDLSFGAANPLGLARYARVGGKPEILLLPAFVAEEWEAVVGER